MQNRRKLPVMFEQQEALLGHAVDSRASTVNILTDTDVPGVEQSLEAPIKAVAGMIEAAQLHKFKKLVMAYELRIAHLPEQRNIALSVDDEAAFSISHRRSCQSTVISSSNCNAAPSGRFEQGIRRQIPQV